MSDPTDPAAPRGPDRPDRPDRPRQPRPTRAEPRRPKPGQSPYEAPQVETLLGRLRDQIDAARPMPLSTSVMVSREELLEILDEAIERLPDELRAARWLLKEREEFLAKVKREGDEILDQARARAERMVQRTEVVKAAETRARKIVERSQDQSRKLRNEAEDFCDQRLASFEIILERTMKMVESGRAKLQGASDASGEISRTAPDATLPDDTVGPGSSVFDQDI
jgi:F0F1-type ATP synthase membrane subunit b/b'